MNIKHRNLFDNLRLIRLLLFEIEPMDFASPTLKKTEPYDKFFRSILLSTRDIPKQDSISNSLKAKIQRYIQRDDPRKLDLLIKQKVIPLSAEIGTKGSRYNLLHMCAKNNAYKCIQYILKTQYQQYEDQYKSLVNAKTVEGYTAIALTIINPSHEALSKILELGGVDLLEQDIDIAKKQNNNELYQLLTYQQKTKKKSFINRQALSQPIKFPQTQQTCCQQLAACLLSCLTFGLYEPDEGREVITENMTDFVIDQEIIDYVRINSKKSLMGYDVQWKKAQKLMSGKVTLFDSYNPFDIKQINFEIKNNLIIFQCLSQQPWLLRKLIKPDRNNNYNVCLYPKKMLQIQNVDDYIPYIKDRQVMFLSNKQEMWPMILQKALAKLHSSYFSIAELNPCELMQQITGFPTVQIPISSIKKSQIISFLQETTAKNYLYILKGKEGSELRNQNAENSVECFTVLNFYQKNQKSLVLINCPFSSQKWKQKQQKQEKQRKNKLTQQQKMEQLTLKLIKGHYNAHKQMCVWIDTNKINDYFQSLIVSLSFPNYQRSELKIKTKEHVFFKFRVQNEKDQNIFLQLSNMKTSEVFNLSKLQIIMNEEKEYVPPQELGDINNYDPKLFEIKCLPGEYMCFLETEVFKNMQSLLLLCWSAEPIQPSFVQTELGIVEWFGFLKKIFFKRQQKCGLQVIGEFSLIICREPTNNIVLFKMNVESDCIVEGRKDEKSGYVEMISEQNGHYCVLKKIIKNSQVYFEQKKVTY